MKTTNKRIMPFTYDINYVLNRRTNNDITYYYFKNIFKPLLDRLTNEKFNILITKRITLINFFTNYYNAKEFINIKTLKNIKCDVGVCPICFKRRHLINNYIDNDKYNYNISVCYVEENEEESEEEDPEIYNFNKIEPKNNMCIECSNNKYYNNKRCKYDYVNIDIDIYISLDNQEDLLEIIHNHDINDILEELEFRIRDNPLNTIILNYNSNNIMYEINKNSIGLLKNLKDLKYE